MPKRDLFVSMDVETTGPAPGRGSLISLGGVAYVRSVVEPHAVEEVGRLLVTLDEITTFRDPDTMLWWGGQDPTVWDLNRLASVLPDLGMKRFVAWVEALAHYYDARPVAVMYPAAFDWPWIYFYLINYATNPFGFRVLDLKTLGWAIRGIKNGVRGFGHENWPNRWTLPSEAHTHVADDDAAEQGYTLVQMLGDMERMHDDFGG